MKFTAAVAVLAGHAAAQQTRFIFTFGDSYSTTFFNSQGLTEANAPTANNQMGNPAYPGITSSGGENWADLLTVRLSPAGTVCYDYAASGAAVDNVLHYPQTSQTTPDFREQIANFATSVGVVKPSFAPWTSANSAFIIFMGINDLVSALTFAPYGAVNSTFIAAEQASYFADMNVLYGLGARRFVLAYIPPIYRTPLLSQPAYIGTARPTVEMWNKQLQTNANLFATTHPGVQLVTYDSTPSYNAILDNPTANGAPDNMCFNYDGKSCLWWDPFHPGMAIHRAMASDFHAKLAGLGFY